MKRSDNPGTCGSDPSVQIRRDQVLFQVDIREAAFEERAQERDPIAFSVAEQPAFGCASNGEDRGDIEEGRKPRGEGPFGRGQMIHAQLYKVDTTATRLVLPKIVLDAPLRKAKTDSASPFQKSLL